MSMLQSCQPLHLAEECAVSIADHCFSLVGIAGHVSLLADAPRVTACNWVTDGEQSFSSAWLCSCWCKSTLLYA